MTFSIITCTYNAASTLAYTLESVRRQTWDDVEHIIIDGVSSDETTDMIARYQQEEQRHKVTVICEPDHGLYDAMNKGLSLATGDYLVFINAGDGLHSDHTLADIAAQTGHRKCGVIYGDTAIIDSEGNSVGLRRLRPPKELSWKSFADGMLVCHQAFFANTDIAKRTPYALKYRLSADVDWCIRVMKEAEREHLPLHNTGEILCNYLEGGMSVQNHRASLLERFNIMRRHYGLLTTIYKHITFLFR